MILVNPDIRVEDPGNLDKLEPYRACRVIDKRNIEGFGINLKTGEISPMGAIEEWHVKFYLGDCYPGDER